MSRGAISPVVSFFLGQHGAKGSYGSYALDERRNALIRKEKPA